MVDEKKNKVDNVVRTRPFYVYVRGEAAAVVTATGRQSAHGNTEQRMDRWFGDNVCSLNIPRYIIKMLYNIR